MVSKMECGFAVGLRGAGSQERMWNQPTYPSALHSSTYPGKVGFGSRPSERLAKAKRSAQGRGGSRRLSHKFVRESGGSATKTNCLYVIVTTTPQELETVRSSNRARHIFCLGVFTEQLGPLKSPLPRCTPACADTEFQFSDSVQSAMVTVRNRFAPVSLLLVDGFETVPDDALRSLIWPPCFCM